MFWKTLLNESHIMPMLGTRGSLIERSALYGINQGTAENLQCQTTDTTARTEVLHI